MKGGAYMAGWTILKYLLETELIQRTEEGCDLSEYSQKFAAAGDDLKELNYLYDEIMELEPNKTLELNEPNELDEIRKKSPRGAAWNYESSKTDKIDIDLFYGAWLGRCCGCALGKPIETTTFMAGKDGIPGWKLVY